MSKSIKAAIVYFQKGNYIHSSEIEFDGNINLVEIAKEVQSTGLMDDCEIIEYQVEFENDDLETITLAAGTINIYQFQSLL